MNLRSLLPLLATLIPFSATAQVSPIRAAVEQISKSESKDKTGHSKTQVRSLKIRLDNNSNESFDGLEVKYWFFGRGMKESQVKVLKSGERKATIGPRGKEIVDSEEVSSSYVEEHYETQRGGGGNRGGGNNRGGRAKKVEASGEKISGYAVKIMKDGKVMAETYSEMSFKDKLKESN